MSSATSLLRQTAADSLVVFTFKMLAVPIGYSVPVVVARLYGAQVLGTYSIVANLLLAITVFCCLGLDQGLMRFAAALKAEGKTGSTRHLLWPAVTLVTLLSGVALLGIFFSRGCLAQRFHAPQLPPMLTIAAFSIPVMTVGFLVREFLRGLGGARWVSFQFSILTPVCILLLVSIPFFLSTTMMLPATTVGFAILLSSGIGLMYLGVKLRSELRNQTGSRENSFPDLLRYSWPLFLSSIVLFFLTSLDRLILGLFNAPDQVAYYEAAVKTATLVVFPLVAINAVVPPLFAKFHQLKDHVGLESMAQATARWTFFLALPISLLSFLLAADLLRFFGAGFVEGTWALRLVIMAQLFNVACGSVGVILAMAGLQWSLTKIQASTALLCVPLMVYASWKYGLIGLAAVRTLWFVGVNLLMTQAVWRHLGIKAFANKIQIVLLGGVVGTALYIFAEPYLGIWGSVVVFCMGYVAVVARPLRQELALLF
jgi:O-antigen/teichoic acid export membrane protein